MYFSKQVLIENVVKWCEIQATASMTASQHGIDVEIKQHKKQRTFLQNRYFMAVLQAIIRFYQETGFKPHRLDDWAMDTDVLKVFWKKRFAVEKTSKLSTKEFGEFVDGIQREMVELSGGNYEMIIPPDQYLESLTKGMEND